MKNTSKASHRASTEAKGNRSTQPKKNQSLVHSIADKQWVALRTRIESERKRFPSHKKLTKEESETLAEGMQQAASLFVNPRATYTFRLVDTYNVLTDAGGAMNRYFSWDASLFSEHTAYLSNMFQEVRIRRSRITVAARCGVPAADGSIPTAVLSSTMRFNGSNPTGPGDVQEESNSRLITTNAFEPQPHSFVVEVPDDFLFADCSTPSPSANRGTYGQWWVALVSTGAVSTPSLHVMIENIYEYRSRD